jgi:hypothetical protein
MDKVEGLGDLFTQMHIRGSVEVIAPTPDDVQRGEPCEVGETPTGGRILRYFTGRSTKGEPLFSNVWPPCERNGQIMGLRSWPYFEQIKR